MVAVFPAAVDAVGVADVRGRSQHVSAAARSGTRHAGTTIASSSRALGVGRYLVNSVFLAAAVTAVSLVFNVAAGYAFAKLRFAGRDRIFKLLLGALVIPAQVAMVPLFLLLKQLGLVNSYGGVIVPAMAGIFGIFLVRQYALSIPDELLEAARIDGASEFRIFGADRRAGCSSRSSSRWRYSRCSAPGTISCGR